MRNRLPHTDKEGFTLAELLVVIAIIGIMFAIALPSLTGITGQTKLEAAANTVHSAAKLARQYAITHNQPTYLLFHDEQSTSDPNLAYRAFAVFTIDTHKQPVTQDNGYYLKDWERLPTGVVFDNETGAQGSENIFYPTTADWGAAISKNNVLNIQNTSFIVQGFKPSGKGGSITHWIFLAEGFYENGKLIRTSQQGKVIKSTLLTSGQSRIVDTLYTESGEAEELTE